MPLTTSAESLRLAVFTDTALPQLNGVSHTLDRLAHAVRERGGAVRIFTTTDPRSAPDADVVRYRSVPFPTYPEVRFATPSARAAARELRGWGATLVHAATPFGLGVAGRRAARRLGVPLVTSYHTSLHTYATYCGLDVLTEAGWAYLRWFHNGGLRTYCPTRAVERELAGRGVRGTEVWGRGVDAFRFRPDRRSTELRRRLGAPDDRLLVVYVGRLASEKGLDVALAAMRRLHAAAPERYAFALAGDGPYADRCRRLAPPGTVFTGQLVGDALGAFYASGDVFVFPSAIDTFGNVLLEAMASGLPVVAADTAPTREVLAGGGITFPVGDDAALAERIAALDADPARRRLVAQAGLASARRRTWSRVFDELVADYLRVQTGAEEAATSPALDARHRARSARRTRPALRVAK